MKIVLIIAAAILLAAPLGALAQEETEAGKDTTLGEWIQKAADLTEAEEAMGKSALLPGPSQGA